MGAATPGFTGDPVSLACDNIDSKCLEAFAGEGRKGTTTPQTGNLIIPEQSVWHCPLEDHIASVYLNRNRTQFLQSMRVYSQTKITNTDTELQSGWPAVLD